jgi:lipoate-protein ligase A
MRWTLTLDPIGRPGWWNMAIDQALLEEAGRTGNGFARLYRWEPHCLSFGRHEPALRRYDRGRIAAQRLDTVRRPTGGRAVWHAGEVTYAVAAPLSWFGTLAEGYRAIHTAVAAAIERLGVPASLAPHGRPVAVSAGACFASPAGGEVLSGGRKLVGSAQLRLADAFLQHGSLLLDGDQRLVSELLLGVAPPGQEITLSEAAGRPIGFDHAAQALAAELRGLGGEWREQPAGDEAPLATRHATRFRDPAWTWRR